MLRFSVDRMTLPAGLREAIAHDMTIGCAVLGFHKLIAAVARTLL